MPSPSAQLREIEANIVNALARQLGAPVSSARHFRHFYLQELATGGTPLVPMTSLPFRVRSDSEEYKDVASPEEQALVARQAEIESKLLGLKAELAAVKRRLETARAVGDLVNPYEYSDDAQLVESGLIILTGKAMMAPATAAPGTPKVVQQAKLSTRGKALAQQFLETERRRKRACGSDLAVIPAKDSL